jgi:magnesium-transporting ATPase (P-type)
MEILSVCHTVIAEKAKNGTGSLVYNASSPDELALVNAAKFFGYNFKGRDEDNNMLVEVNEDNEDISIGSPVKQYALLNVIEFTSTRKRMSVIVRDLQNETIRVMCKGADSIVIPRLRHL